MAQYRLKIGLNPGSGTITVDGLPPEVYYEEGTSLTIAVSLDAGWNSIEWFRAGVSISTLTSFVFVMPSQDVSIRGVASGQYEPVDGYGLKYYWEFKQNTLDIARCIRIELYKDGYGGASSPIRVENIFYNWGNFGDNPLKTLIGSSIDFTIAGTIDQFEEFLEGDNRTWKAVLYDAGVVFFVGFVSPDFVTQQDKSGLRIQQFTAIDGIKGFDSIRTNPFIFPGSPRDKAHNAIIGALNQSFIEFRPVNFAVNIYETRMSDLSLMFTQFFTPDNAIYTDGEIAKFVDGVRIENETLYLSETLERLANPFLCRVFLYDNEFWVVRIPELAKLSYSGFKYLPDATLDEAISVSNDLVIDCDINNPERTARRVFTDFTAILKLGTLFLETLGSVYEAKFASEEWFVGSAASPYPGRYVLRRWDYIRATPTNQPTSVPSGDTALVQYVSANGEDSCQIWTTTTTAGDADPNISYISLSTDSTGRIIEVAEETANKISLSFRYMLVPVSSTNPNTETNHAIGFMLKVGTFYLEQLTATTFGWTLTPTIVQFAGENSYVFNTVNITNLTVPVTGEVELRLYQLILNAGTRHQYTIRYDDVKLTIEQNEALQLSEIAVKGVTDNPYSNIHPEYITYIGDAETNLSTSAIRLDITDTPVSELWSRDGIESEPLLDIICQDLANLKGRTNRRIIGTLERVKPYPYQSVQYRDSLWMIIAIEWDSYRDSWRVELFELGPIPVS